MISKHIECAPANDNYRRLANYIAADHEQDKVTLSWFSGCVTEDDYDIAVSEVLAAQALNTTSKKEKTYHLLVSFRPEDVSKLTPPVWREIEARFASALGLQEHQRHCGVHRNTGNLHLHVAYSLIHPKSHNRVEPFGDYRKRDRLCRELEREYGLYADKGIEEKKENAISAEAADMEAFSGRQSFASYCQERKEGILSQINLAQDWQAVHEVLAQYSIVIKPHGNGLVLQDMNNQRHNMKASNLERNLSKGKLESRLGTFREAQKPLSPAQEAYQAEALGNAGELQKYEQAKSDWQKALAEIKSPFLQKMAANKAKWQQKRRAYQLMPLTKKDRAMLIKNSRALEGQERQEIYAKIRELQRGRQGQNLNLSWPQYRRKNPAQQHQLQPQDETGESYLLPLGRN